MEAIVQYNDFIGSAAADISDHIDLNAFLIRRGVDTDRYDAIGASFYHGYSDFFRGSIICLDKKNSIQEKPYIVALSFEAEFTHEEFFDLFKRFDVEITLKYGGYREHSIDEEIIIDDRESNKQ